MSDILSQNSNLISISIIFILADEISILEASPYSRIKQDNNKKYVIVFILFLANLLNYFDRSSLLGICFSFILIWLIIGILIDVQKDFKLDDKGSAMINSVFMITYMLFSPIFGYFGDHYSRKWLIVIGLLFWSVFTLLGSYVSTDVIKIYKK